jgi:hypothetical protein
MNGNDPDAAQGLYGGNDDVEAVMGAYQQMIDTMQEHHLHDEAEKLGLGDQHLALAERLLAAEAHIVSLRERVEQLEPGERPF